MAARLTSSHKRLAAGVRDWKEVDQDYAVGGARSSMGGIGGGGLWWFLEADGSLSREVMPDSLHLNAWSYQIWADAITPTLETLLRWKSARARLFLASTDLISGGLRGCLNAAICAPDSPNILL